MQENRQSNDLENNACGVCKALAAPPPCRGHGGGGGGGDSESNKENAPKQKNQNNFETPKNTHVENQINYIKLSISDEKYWARLPLIGENVFYFENPKALFSIQMELNEIDQGILTFKNKNGLSDTHQAFLAIITNELEKFKNELSEKGIKTNGFEIKEQNNNLLIKISDKALFMDFIARLIEKNLLPHKDLYATSKEENIALENKQENTNQKIFNPSPFSNKPKPHWIKK